MLDLDWIDLAPDETNFFEMCETESRGHTRIGSFLEETKVRKGWVNDMINHNDDDSCTGHS